MTAATQTAFEPDYEYELVDGQLEAKEMAGMKHGGTIIRLAVRLGMHVEANDLGGVYSPDTTFMVGQNQRLPDLAFVSNERMPEGGETEGIAPMAPDLAIEVISPNDIWEKVTAKIEDYFAAGVRQVWLVSLRQRNVNVYDSPTKVTILTENEDLTSEAILPGFRCRIAEIFGKKPIAPAAAIDQTD
ncbi:MAG TPA: Uma2 family endonuclease, partial [Blastocatellia bacterium]|nr:Uma2 family endonuclease [Blastocatellia bacterium]